MLCFRILYTKSIFYHSSVILNNFIFSYFKEIIIEKINKIFFKVDNMYDTCHIRLHIRKVENSWPSSELLTEDIIIPIYKRSMIDGTSVFDLSKQNLVLSEKTLFIGFEVIDCSNSTKPPTSISFVGTDNGEYIFKSFSSSSWEKQNNFSIYFELGLQY